ncbi:SOS response-associated peptidase family protein [Winogradskyella costae]|uniref:SOS response-associated peptidase family protein n=1 Tax=Winogradskyella costae TaxID=2697008 RepID=UPI0015CB3E45|nr:SOS response-associated peptidase family protein [Winogradskyella costae]
MFYKLSSTANLKDIESVFNAQFRYPLLYNSKPIINGLSEQSLPIMRMNNSNVIEYAIWGMLPDNYNDGWDNFQNLTNTLNISIDKINELDWMKSSLVNKRCVVIVSGFFASYLYNGEVYPFYVYAKNRQPFTLAGVYSRLADGFMTVSLVTTTAGNGLKHVHNLGQDFPICMSANNYKEWLNIDLARSTDNIENIKVADLKAHTISKEFYKNDIIFESVLDPAHYNDLPLLSIS